MVQSIRVGIVGATVTPGGSGFGQHAHIPALHAAPGVELRAVCTSRPETARAAAEAFGAPLAFHDVRAMVASDEVDLVVVSVRVPWHRELVMAAIEADKPVFCEWPLGVSAAEAAEMAEAARGRGLPTMVGLQARSDPTLGYARELIAEGWLGEVLLANVTAFIPATFERGAGRVWHADPANGANPLTIPGGHTIDAACFLLGEFTSVAGRVTTRVPSWRNTETGAEEPVTSPDTVGVVGRLAGGAEVAVQVAAVPVNASGTRIEIHGREGSMVITAPKAQIGPNRLVGARRGQDPVELVPPGSPAAGGSLETLGARARNVAEAYVRIAAAWEAGRAFEPDFDHAVRRHRLLEAIERSSAEGRTIDLGPDLGPDPDPGAA